MDDLDPQILELVQTSWTDAYWSARKTVDAIREIYPEVTTLLPEAVERRINGAMTESQVVISQLYEAGPDIFGENDWQSIVKDHIEWRKNG